MGNWFSGRTEVLPPSCPGNTDTFPCNKSPEYYLTCLTRYYMDWSLLNSPAWLLFLFTVFSTFGWKLSILPENERPKHSCTLSTWSYGHYLHWVSQSIRALLNSCHLFRGKVMSNENSLNNMSELSGTSENKARGNLSKKIYVWSINIWNYSQPP